MKKKNIFSSLFLVLVLLVDNAYGQTSTPEELLVTPTSDREDTANLTLIDNDPDTIAAGLPRTADAVFRTVLLDDFETPQGWYSDIPLDFGVSRVIYRQGSPEEIASESNTLVLGVKTLFFRRNFGWMSLDRPYPITIRNVVKSFSLWVAGRNRRHELFIKVRDICANNMQIPLGEMMWQGWKKVITPVKFPVVQQDHKLSRKGLDFFGFHIKFNGEDIVVSEPYYIYVDYLTAVMDFTDVLETDDMADNW